LLDHPVVIAEILSPSNARETREAVRACMEIASLREILVIDSVQVQAEHIARTPYNEWPADPTVIGPSGDIKIGCLGFRVPLADLYVGTGLSVG
jgi:Uma2 family endonuclease